MSSLDVWRGEFGTEYTARNSRYATRDKDDNRLTLRQLTAQCLAELDSVLEVGCNKGHNLNAWTPEASSVIGIEPNGAARDIALNQGFDVRDGHIGALPFVDGTFDLVFTAGVLIHINPGHLDRALHEIRRVSRRYILSIEYEHGHEIGVEYRGISNGIWKRNYGMEWRIRYPDLTLVKHWPESELQDTAFDGCSAWLLDRRPPVSGR